MTTLQNNRLSTDTALLEPKVMLASLATKPVIAVVPGTDNIQGAIDEAADAGGGRVILQKGVHQVTDTIDLRSNVSIEGGTNDRAETVIKFTDDSGENINKDLINGLRIENVKIENLKLRGPQSNTSDASSNTATNQMGIHIQGHGNSFDSPATDFENKNVDLVNVEVRNFGSHGIHIKGAEDVDMNYVWAWNNGMSDGDLYHNSYLRRVEDVSVTNSTFEKSPSGHGFRVGFGKDVYLGNSLVTLNADHGIHVSEETNIAINNNMNNQPSGSTYGSYDNGQNPTGRWRNVSAYSLATIDWVDSNPF